MGAAKAFDFATNKEQVPPGAKDLPVKRATLFVSRMTVRTVLVRELKSYGIPLVNCFDSPMECCEDLLKNPESLFVVDWEHGEQAVMKVLKAAQGPYRIDTRPIYFIALDLAERVIAVANEFNVMQIHTGEISRAQIVKNLNELLDFSAMSTSCRKTFRDLVALRKSGNIEATENLLQDLCEGEPGNIRASLEMGATLFDLGRFQEAEDWMSQLHANHRDDLRAQHLFARCLMKRGEFEKAQKILEQAWLISPHNVDRLVDLGNILLNLNKTEAALGKFNEALKLDKDLLTAKVGKAQCNLLKDHVNEAMKLLGQIDNPQELASIFNSAAILAIRHEQHKQGLSLYKSAVTFVASDSRVLARVFFNMGLGFVKWGKSEQALKAFEQAASLDEKFTKASHNIEVLKGLKAKGMQVPMPQRLHELEELSQEDEDFGSIDFGVKEPAKKLAAAAGDDEENEVDDSYFQSLVSDS